MSKRHAFDNRPFAKVNVPLCATLLKQTSEQKTRHPATVLALSETGAEFSSPQKVTSGETVSFIFHPDLRYAIRGKVTWVRQTADKTHFDFGVTFEENIPNSLWESLAEQLMAA